MAASVRPSTGRRQGTPSLIRFFSEMLEELRKVSWPTAAELYRYTLVVIITVVVLAAFIGAIDEALGWLAKKFIYAPVVGK
jgi:preprotein translocase subunit SecE